jgi:hypothetical protein
MLLPRGTALQYRSDRAISISEVRPFLKEGEVVSLADVFPFEWDEVEIANAPGGIGDFYADLLEYDPSFVAWHDIHFLVIFYRDGKVIEYFQYLLGTDDITPVFGEKPQLELGWHKRILRENACFVCVGFQGEDGVFVCTLSSDM